MKCPDCGWPTPTGACGRCINERIERRERLSVVKDFDTGYVRGFEEAVAALLRDLDRALADDGTVQHVRSVMEDWR